MSDSLPVERVIQQLKAAGFRPLPSPIAIATIPFDFAGILVRPERALDLVAVVDTLTDTEPRVRQKVEGLGRALDLVGSRRPLTVILVGPPPRAITLQALNRVSRVLTVGTPVGETADKQVTNALAVLLPLSLPDASEIVVDAKTELLAHLEGEPPAETVNLLFDVSGQGKESVTKEFLKIVKEPLEAEERGAAV